MDRPFVECREAIALFDKHLQNLCELVESFPAEALWRRPRPGIVSLGALSRHVAGSMRDWFENGIAGGNWRRDRAAEFTEEAGPDALRLVEHVRQTRAAVDPILAEIDAVQWEARRSFRGQTFTVRQIVLHQLEHVAYHAGQASFLRWLVGGMAPKSL